MKILSDVWTILADHVVVLAIVAFLLVAAGFLWQRLLDLANSLVYHPNVQGKWNTLLNRGTADESHEKAELHQLGSHVWGTTKTQNGSRQYRVNGRICGEKLWLVYREIGTSASGLDAGAALLAIRTDGKTLEGYELGCDLATGALSSFKYRWSRDGS